MLANERVESLKAGILGSAALLLGYGLVALGNYFWLALPSSRAAIELGCAVAAASGFLFGVTYRYIIRADQNSHLRSGAVLAFGLVRGLGQLEVGFNLQLDLWLLSLGILESIFLFALGRWCLDWTIGLGWIKRFENNS